MIIPKHEDIIKNPRKYGKQSLIKYYNEFYELLIRLYPDIDSCIERLYMYMMKLDTRPKCNCGNELRFLGYNLGYRKYCSEKCAGLDKVRQDEISERNRVKYGVNRPSQLQEVKDKVKKTCDDRYGGMGFGSDITKQKIQKTNIDRYGEKYAIKSHQIKDKVKKTCDDRYGGMGFGSDITKQKIQKTNIDRYGVSNAALNESIAEKIKNTNNERYGVNYTFESEEIRNKSKETCLKKYGVPNALLNDDIKARAKNNTIKKYGAVGLAVKEFKDKAHDTNLKKYGTKTPSKSDKVKLDTIKKFQDKYNVDCGLQATLFKKYPDLIGISNKIWIMSCPHPECNKCKDKLYKTRSMIYNDRLKGGIELCTNLLPIDKDRSKNTSLELFVKNILDEYNVQYIENDRSILAPKEIDIYIPSKKIAIECNGVYWHSSNKLAKSYHINKYKDCEDKGIQLITLWEDWIKHKSDIVKSIILSKLNLLEHKIYARKCEIKEVDSKTCSIFLDENHIQGSTRSKIRLGLYYNDELVCVMTFGKKRAMMGTYDDCIELLRFCSKKYYTIVGGADKLFKYFLKKYNPTQITSYSSNDISTGNLYKLLGFNYINTNSSYWYINLRDHKRYHRYNFTKYKLLEFGFDDMPEQEIMKKVGFLKIYDSGQKTWIYNCI